jgi:hypothetical protein
MTNPTRDYWINQTNQSIPGTNDHIAHNAGITKSYAGWFTKHQDICKWSGMAVFASYRVGKFLKVLHTLEDKILKRDVGFLNKQIQLMREINNGIFDTIGWVHFAYLSPRGGLPAVEQSLYDLPSSAKILEGFRQIDQGRLLLNAGKTEEGNELVWKGNSSLLHFEQHDVVQPIFEKFSSWFNFFMSVTAVSNFTFSLLQIRLKYLSAFYPYMLWHRQIPNIADFTQRWEWVEAKALPLWNKTDTNASTIRFMEGLAAKIV